MKILSNKFAWLSLVIVVILVTVASLANYWWVKRIEKEHLLNIYMPTISDIIASSVGSKKQSLRVSSEQMFITFSSNNANHENTLALLRESLSHSPFDYVYYISATDTPTRYYCYRDACDYEELDFNKPFDNWFNAFVDSGKAHSLAIANTPHKDKKVLFNNFLFREGSQSSAAAFGTGVYLTSQLLSMFRNQMEMPVYINIVNEHAELIFDSADTPVDFKAKVISHLDSFWQNAAKENAEEHITEQQGVVLASKFLENISTTGVSSQHWYLMVSLDSKALFAKASSVLLMNLIIGVLYILFFVLTVGGQFRRYDRHLQQEAMIDKLTGKPNRKMLTNAYENITKRMEKFNEQYAFIVFDLDKFKPINDTYGHAVGDQMLIEFSDRLSSTLRESDVFGRLGGDEFICLLKTSPEHADRIIERMHNVVEKEPFHSPDGPILDVRFSYGLYMIKAAENFETSFKQADANLYEHKSQRSGQ